MRNTGANLEIRVNNLSISYLDEGPLSAPAIIFLHGFPFHKSMWSNQIETFKDHFRVIAYDVRGHGDSEAGTENFSIEKFTDDLLALMDALEIENPILCGLSMGGYIVLNAAVRYPKLFSALVLCDTQCLADNTETRTKRMEAIHSINTDGVEKYAEDSIKKLFAPLSFSEKKQEIAAIRAMMLQTSKQALSYTLFALSERKGTCSKLQDIEIPVLILVGKEDKITPPSASTLMHEKIQGSLLKIIENAGHLSNLENPKEFNSQLDSFVQQVAKRPSKHLLFEKIVV